MDFTSIASANPGGGLTERTIPYPVILAAVPDDVAAPVLEALALVDTVALVPMPSDPRATHRALARQQVEAVLSGSKHDLVKACRMAVADHDAQVLAHHVSRQARTEIGSHAAGALVSALPAMFAYWSERLADVQQQHAALVDEYGALLCVDELNARRADRLEVYTEASTLRAEHDAIREAHRAARVITDHDHRMRFAPEASYRFSDGSAVLNTDVTTAVSAVFASTDQMTAASSLSWICWAPSPSEQQHAVQARLARAS
jgi:hypothetical protein